MTKRKMPRTLRRTMLRSAPLWMGLCAATLGVSVAEAQTKISTAAHGYPRVRKLSNGEVLVSGTAFGSSSISIFSSTDEGVTFTKVGTITDSEFADGLCCGTIFVLPQAVGTLASGTILWAGSVGQNATDRRMKIKVYKSTDNGRTWSYLSTAVTAPNTGGLWEPDFWIANDGALVMAYSDETLQGTYSQRLMKIRTYNGTSWVDGANMVASSIQADRPGMAVVSKMASGTRFMTFELCGPAACTTFYKTSTDGWDWGAATNVGSAIRLSDGRYFAHAPTNKVMPDGSLLVIGQMLMTSSNTVAAANGTVIFKSASGSPSGPWATIAAPVPVPGANNTPCINYSSSLLPVASGAQILEIAGKIDSGTCYLYFNRGSAN